MSSIPPQTRRIAGLDPGLASGSMVVIDHADRQRVLAAISLVEERGTVKRAEEQAQRLADELGGWSDKEFLAADLRARAWVKRFLAALDAFEAEHGQVDVFAIESFVDQKQHAKQMMKNRWQAPLVIGLLIRALEERGYTSPNGRLVYQNAGTVLTQLGEERNRLKDRRTHDRDLVVPGDRQVTNDHQRSAFAHALALSLRLPKFSTAPALATTA